MSEIRAVVFDLDGLMFNTEHIFDELGEALLAKRGKVMTPELKLAMIGRRPHESLQLMIDTHSLTDRLEDLAEESQRTFFEIAADRLAPMPGLHELLSHIDDCGLPKGLATSSSAAYVQRVVEPFGLLPQFSVILTAEDVTHGKPHPEIYLKAADKLGIRPHEMMVLEDSQNGTNSAAAAGAVAIAVPHDHTRNHDFSRAYLIAESLKDPRVLELLPKRKT